MSKQLEIILKSEQLEKIPINEQITYKYLTELLEQKYITGGTQKEAQLSEFNRYFDFEFLPNRKMIVKEIHIKPPEDKEILTNSLFIPSLLYELLCCLCTLT